MTLPDPITLGHALMLAGVLAGLYGAWQLLFFLRHRGHERGTPGYARGRDARRFALWSVAAGTLLYLIGCFTPLAEVAIAGGAA